MPGDLVSFFSTGDGWGRVAIDSAGATVTVDGGTVDFHSLTVGARPLHAPQGTGTATIPAGHSIRFTYQNSQEEPT